jgi:predicted N-acyltransferase
MDWHTTAHASIEDIDERGWAGLDCRGDIFLRHEFLAAAERHGAAAARLGWQPMHLALRDRNGNLQGALPLYLKTHSFGDFSQDWNWAAAYERAGLSYYPKLVSGIPYTPATGPRLLVSRGANRAAVAGRLIEAAIDCARRMDCAAWQCLFVEESDLDALAGAGLLLRRGCQFHWSNRGYGNFGDFLAGFSADKRKKVKRERRRAAEAGLSIETLHGDEIDLSLWNTIHRHYRDTFRKYGNHAAFTVDFFADVAARLGRGMVVFVAREAGEVVASAICYRSGTTLYGRHWGAGRDYPGLHFELCYYQGIEYCIRNGLARFEPGAHGEHKVSRGFSPVATWSAHWIADAGMRRAIGDYLERERPHMEIYQAEMGEHEPYKANLAPP